MKHPLSMLSPAMIIAASVVLTSCGTRYQTNQGEVFGTFYSIQYESDKDLHPMIKESLIEFDNSLSTFNPNSIIAKINRNEEVETDEYFETMYEEAVKISECSQGAFDITVGPLVNLWGFGFKHKEVVTQEKVDSLLELANYLGITLSDHHIYKRDPRIMLDAAALAKGYACDVIAEELEEAGVHNYLVDIGGEVVAKGVNKKGEKWHIAITKPIDDPTGSIQENQEVLKVDELCMATSGNYRNYYMENGEKRSHTIDPRTGYPVHHNLLSATVIASSCMRADALATTCMVMGEEQALELINSIEDAACYLIVAENDELQIIKSDKWGDIFGDDGVQK